MGVLPFFSRNPRDDLFRLNGWAADYAEDFASLGSLASHPSATRPSLTEIAFGRSRKRAGLRRLAEGSAAWSVWASKMIAIRSRLEDTDPLCRAWHALAATDLRDEMFSDIVDAVAFVFPGAVDLSGAKFGQDVWFNQARFIGPARFDEAVFAHEATFEGVRFEDTASFVDVSFVGCAQMRNAAFTEAASFAGSEFEDDCWLRGSRFVGEVTFAGASFLGEAGLGACIYGATADFASVHFARNAGFDSACFSADVDFSDARFERNAWFSGAVFRGAANFDRARFLGRKHFDDIDLAEPRGRDARRLQEMVLQAVN